MIKVQDLVGVEFFLGYTGGAYSNNVGKRSYVKEHPKGLQYGYELFRKGETKRCYGVPVDTRLNARTQENYPELFL